MSFRESNIYSRIQSIKKWRLFRNLYPSAPYHSHQESKPSEASSDYSPDAIYEDRTPDFGNAEQPYERQEEIAQPVLRTPEPVHIPHPDIEPEASDYLLDKLFIELALEDITEDSLDDMDDADEPLAQHNIVDDNVAGELFDELIEDASTGTLEDIVEAADIQDEMYDDQFSGPSLEDIMEDAMDEPDDMPEPEPEPDPEPMDDPMHPYMPFGGFPFPPGG